MHILITGAKGQLGTALQLALKGNQLTLIDLPEFDITHLDQIVELVVSTRPDIVIHCAAYTDVDGCVRDPELAYRVNALGTQNVALACLAGDAAMVHISTNEVFSGANPSGYEEWMPLSPRNPYGRTKAAAECFVQSILNRYYIVRTAWLFAPGGRNFIHTILNKAREAGPIRVVADEIGNPTYVYDLAEAINRLIRTGQYGIYHFVNSGGCSRYAFAMEILRLGGAQSTAIIPILSTSHQRLSSPPPFAELHNRNGQAIGLILRPWPEALADFMRHQQYQ